MYYSMHSLSNGTGLLLLCEVAAKPFHELTSAVSPLPRLSRPISERVPSYVIG